VGHVVSGSAFGFLGGGCAATAASGEDAVTQLQALVHVLQLLLRRLLLRLRLLRLRWTQRRRRGGRVLRRRRQARRARTIAACAVVAWLRARASWRVHAAQRGAKLWPLRGRHERRRRRGRGGGGGRRGGAELGGAICANTASLAGVPPGPGLGSMPARTSASHVRCDVSYAGAAGRGAAASCAGGRATGVKLSRERAPKTCACVAVPRVRCRQVLAGRQRGAVRCSTRPRAGAARRGARRAGQQRQGGWRRARRRAAAWRLRDLRRKSRRRARPRHGRASAGASIRGGRGAWLLAGRTTARPRAPFPM
jgi:hypothetical protein